MTNFFHADEIFITANNFSSLLWNNCCDDKIFIMVTNFSSRWPISIMVTNYSSRWQKNIKPHEKGLQLLTEAEGKNQFCRSRRAHLSIKNKKKNCFSSSSYIGGRFQSQNSLEASLMQTLTHLTAVYFVPLMVFEISLAEARGTGADKSFF